MVSMCYWVPFRGVVHMAGGAVARLGGVYRLHTVGESSALRLLLSVFACCSIYSSSPTTTTTTSSLSHLTFKINIGIQTTTFAFG